MKYIALILLSLALVGCCRESNVVYRIPADKQADAANLMVELTRYSVDSRRPQRGAETVRHQVEFIYGEPVVIQKGDRK